MPHDKCTPEAVEAALRLKRGGANNDDIAAAIGIHRATFYRWVNEPKTQSQRDLRDGLKKAEAEYKNAVLAIILKAARDKDWKAAAWLLERKYPAEYSRSTRADERAVEQAPTVVLGVVPKVAEK